MVPDAALDARLSEQTDEAFERVLLDTKRASRRRLSDFIGLALGCALAAAADVACRFLPGCDYNDAAISSLAVLFGTSLCAPPLVDLLLLLRSSSEQRRRERELYGDVGARWLRMTTSSAAALSLTVTLVYVLLSTEAKRWALRPDDLLDTPSRLLTHGLWHADATHLGLNVAGLLAFGVMVDLRIGRPRTLLLCVLSVLIGGAAEAWMRWGEDVHILGVSAAVYGLAAAMLVLMPTRPAAVYGVRLPQWVPLSVALTGFVLFDALLSADVALYAHLSGLLIGAAVGLASRGLPVPAVYAQAEARRQQLIKDQQGL